MDLIKVSKQIFDYIEAVFQIAEELVSIGTIVYVSQ